MVIFLIVCICTYQSCVWCCFPSLGLILTSSLCQASPHPQASVQCPGLGLPLFTMVVESCPAVQERSPNLLAFSPLGIAGPHNVLAIPGIKIQLFGANLFTHLNHYKCSAHVCMFSTDLILHNHFYYPHLCISLKPAWWTEPSAFLYAAFHDSWSLELKNCILLEPCFITYFMHSTFVHIWINYQIFPLVFEIILSYFVWNSAVKELLNLTREKINY